MLNTGRVNQYSLFASIEQERRGVKLTFFVGVDASNVTFEVLTPGKTFTAITYDTNEGTPSSVGAVRADGVWGCGDAPSPTFLCQIWNRNRTGLPATAFCWRRYNDGQRVPRLVGRL